MSLLTSPGLTSLSFPLKLSYYQFLCSSLSKATLQLLHLPFSFLACLLLLHSNSFLLKDYYSLLSYFLEKAFQNFLSQYNILGYSVSPHLKHYCIPSCLDSFLCDSLSWSFIKNTFYFYLEYKIMFIFSINASYKIFHLLEKNGLLYVFMCVYVYVSVCVKGMGRCCRRQFVEI